MTLASLSIAAVLLAQPLAEQDPASSAQRPPNIVLIVADDLGWGDLGCYGQRKIRTPHIDRLASEGMLFSRHYSGCAVCAPSRCVLLTGMHPGHAFIRDNRSVGEEGQYPIPDELVTLPELLRGLGYATGAFGKWGLGGPDSSGAPLRQGVDRFFGYNCQGVAHNFYPTYLWDDDRKLPLDNPPFEAHQRFPPDADPADPRSFDRYRGNDYSADLIAAQAVRFIRENADRPFFLFHPTTIPHLALQAPEDAVAEYRDEFDDEPYLGEQGYLPQPYPRACYAAMVSRMDRHVGDILATLDELGLAERTIVVFTSDNGPLPDRYGGTDTDFFQSAGALRGGKGSLYEGGIRVPLLVRYPGRVAPGTVSDRVTGFEDMLPTLLELIAAADRVPADVDGLSFAATLRGGSQEERPFLYREFPGYGGQQAVFAGRWKAVRQSLRQKRGSAAPLRTELYDLQADPSETTDVAGAHPDVLSRLEAILAEQHTPSAEFPLPGIDE